MDRLLPLDPKTEMEITADLVLQIIAAGVPLDPAELERVTAMVRRRAELAVIGDRMARDPEIPPAVLAAYDQWATGQLAADEAPDDTP
jgi:hypothetical protein